MHQNVKFAIKTIANKLFSLESANGHLFINKFGRDAVIVDLGACKGEFSKIFLERHSYSKAILVEPNPYLFQKLNLTFANLDNIYVHNACVGSKSVESLPFYISNNPEGSSLYKVPGDQKYLEEVKVSMISIRDIFSMFKIEKIDLLKMDIERAEWDVFDHFSEDEFKKIHQISVEFHDWNNFSSRKKSEKCINKLQHLGYSFIHPGKQWGYPAPYFNCLFFNRKQLRPTNILRWVKISF